MDNLTLMKDVLDLANSGSFEEAIYHYKENKLDRYTIYLAYKKDDLEPEDKQFIKDAVLFLQGVYNNSTYESPISDYDYDVLYEKNKDLSGIDFVGSALTGDTGIFHEYPDLRGSLDKVHYFSEFERGNNTRKSYEKWMNGVAARYRQVTGKLIDLSQVSILVMPKFDGLSVIFELDNYFVNRALLRGDVEKNETDDISFIFDNYKFVNDKIPNGKCGMKTEVVVKRKDFKKMQEKIQDFSSQRSACSSILNSKALDYVRSCQKYLTVIPLQFQDYETKEINVNEFSEFGSSIIRMTDIKELKFTIDNIVSNVENQGLPIDGIVIRILDSKLQQILGRREDNGINNYEVAYKFPPPKKKTRIISLEFGMGKFGNLNPIAKIEPVMMNGNQIYSISIGSIDRLRQLGLARYDEVIVTYDIIPYLYIDETCERSDKKKFKIPEFCPKCGEKLHGYPELQCINDECPLKVKGNILNYLSKMGIKNISSATVDQFFEHGVVKSIKDLYTLEHYRHELNFIKGFGEKKLKNIIKSIDDHRTVKDYVLLGSLGIEDVAIKLFKNICSVYSVEEILGICRTYNTDLLLGLKGVKVSTADKIVAGINKNRKLIEFLMNELHVVSSKGEDEFDSYVTFTKVRDEKFEKFLASKKIGVIEMSKSKTKILIVPDLSVSSEKINKAKKYNIPIIPISEAYKMFEYNNQ